MEKKVQGLNLKALKGAFTSAATNAAQLVGQQLKAGVESVGALKATRDYELGEQVASGGPGRLWSIYRATAKRPSIGVSANVCVWVLDKKALVKEETSTCVPGRLGFSERWMGRLRLWAVELTPHTPLDCRAGENRGRTWRRCWRASDETAPAYCDLGAWGVLSHSLAARSGALRVQRPHTGLVY